MAESQLSELQNMRVLLEEARGLSRNLAYHRRARLEARIGEALERVMNSIRNGLGMRETEIAKEPSRP